MAISPNATGSARTASDWKVGSTFEMVRSDGTVSDAGKVVECDPPRRLAYTFINLSDKYKNEFPALATFVLEPYGKLVKLTLTHEGFAEGSKFFTASPRDGPRSCPASRACWKPAAARYSLRRSRSKA